jgi:hypothetical protein
MQAIGHARAAIAVSAVMLVMAMDARAQEDLDRDKSGPKLFAASCVHCHKSARGLAKGRISFMLSYYLRQHYTSSAQSAEILTAYLQSVDTPPGKVKRAVGKAQASKSQPKGAEKNVETRLPTGTISEDPRVRPPARVPER